MARLLPLFLAASFAVGACGGGDDDDDDDNDVVAPDAMSDTTDAMGDTVDAADAPDPTWTNFAASFFEVYCHMCHGPGDTLRDYSLMSEVQAESARIRSGVDSTQFPVGTGPKPSRAERDRLLLWIDNGLPE